MHYFLLTWGGVVGVYSVGRSFAEKKGAKLWKRLELLQDVSSSLEFPTLATSDVVNGVFSVDNAYYLRKGSRIDLNGTWYNVKEVNDLVITLTSYSLNLPLPTVALQLPYFTHGTANMQNKRVDAKKNRLG